VVASFEHHRGPHGLPHPHVHNIVITALTTGASVPGPRAGQEPGSPR
jgi:hypothetical protein